MNMLYEYLNRRALKTAADPITLDDNAGSAIDRAMKALAEKDAQRRAQFDRDSPTARENLEELVKQLPAAPDLPSGPVPVTVPYGRVIDAVDKAQRHADATKAPAPTKSEIAEARKSTPKGRMDEYLRRMAERQSENDLAKMDDRSEEATATTDEYVRRMLARQSENDLAKMDDRSGDATAATDKYVRRYVRRMAARQNENDLAKMDDRSRDATAETDEYVRNWAARQSENDLAKMDDRSEYATAATDNYVRRMLARQSENDLAKMDARRGDAAAETDGYVRRMAAARQSENDLAKMDARRGDAAAETDNYVLDRETRQRESQKKPGKHPWRFPDVSRRTMAVAGGAAALGSAALVYFLMRKHRRKNKPAVPRKALA